MQTLYQMGRDMMKSMRHPMKRGPVVQNVITESEKCRMFQVSIFVYVFSIPCNMLSIV